jgi:hypothetical protein
MSIEPNEPFRIVLKDNQPEDWAFAPANLQMAHEILRERVGDGTPYRIYERSKLIEKGIVTPPPPKVKHPGKPGRPRKKKLTAAQAFKIRPWEFGIDPRTIPDDVLRSEVARRNALRRWAKKAQPAPTPAPMQSPESQLDTPQLYKVIDRLHLEGLRPNLEPEPFWDGFSARNPNNTKVFLTYRLKRKMRALIHAGIWPGVLLPADRRRKISLDTSENTE